MCVAVHSINTRCAVVGDGRSKGRSVGKVNRRAGSHRTIPSTSLGRSEAELFSHGAMSLTTQRPSARASITPRQTQDGLEVDASERDALFSLQSLDRPHESRCWRLSRGLKLCPRLGSLDQLNCMQTILRGHPWQAAIGPGTRPSAREQLWDDGPCRLLPTDDSSPITFLQWQQCPSCAYGLSSP